MMFDFSESVRLRSSNAPVGKRTGRLSTSEKLKVPCKNNQQQKSTGDSQEWKIMADKGYN